MSKILNVLCKSATGKRWAIESYEFRVTLKNGKKSNHSVQIYFLINLDWRCVTAAIVSASPLRFQRRLRLLVRNRPKINKSLLTIQALPDEMRSSFEGWLYSFNKNILEELPKYLNNLRVSKSVSTEIDINRLLEAYIDKSDRSF